MIVGMQRSERTELVTDAGCALRWPQPHRQPHVAHVGEKHQYVLASQMDAVHADKVWMCLFATRNDNAHLIEKYKLTPCVERPEKKRWQVDVFVRNGLKSLDPASLTLVDELNATIAVNAAAPVKVGRTEKVPEMIKLLRMYAKGSLNRSEITAVFVGDRGVEGRRARTAVATYCKVGIARCRDPATGAFQPTTGCVEGCCDGHREGFPRQSIHQKEQWSDTNYPGSGLGWAGTLWCRECWIEFQRQGTGVDLHRVLAQAIADGISSSGASAALECRTNPVERERAHRM